jgi:signal transduction histidine kinase
MLDVDEAFHEVLVWRAERLRVRVAQAVVVAALAWTAVGFAWTGVWLAATLAIAVIDRAMCRRLLARPGDRGALRLVCCSLVLSASTFSSIAFPLVAQRSHAAVAEAALILCAVNLNNAVMTRASRLASVLILGPSSVVLVVMPLIAVAVGHHNLTWSEVALLQVGATGYLVFLARLASTLRDESQTIRRALADQDQLRRRAETAMEEAVQSRTRWRMLFDQSPLAQLCVDANRLHTLLRPHLNAGETRLGDIAKVMLFTNADALRFISLLDVNEAAEVLFGVDQEREQVNPGRFHADFIKGFCEGLNGMNDDGVLAPFEAKIVRPGGDVVDVRVHVRLPPGQEPAWSRCMISLVDMTEQQRAARAQREAVEAAQTANQAKSEFLAVMSHEIRTPLNGVLGMAQAMELEPLSPVQKERLGVIRQSGGALLEILNDLLDLSKIEAGKLELEITDFDLGGLVGGAQAAFGPLATRKGLDLEVTVEPEVRGLWRGDAVRVRQVVYNLIANAVKFTEAGAVTVRVAMRRAGGVRITVRDTGIGISPDRLPSLFEKFVQADSSTTRRFGGTGLGLAICRELCTAMGGAVAVESKQGVGSLFTVELPLEMAAPGDGAEASDVPVVNAAISGAPLRVLAAEDNSVNQLVLKTLLAQIGIEPMIVGNGAEAVAAFEQGDWDLILMDVQMPVMDGPTAARAIRAREAKIGAAPTPIIALTANAMSHQVESYRAAGMDGILAKPIEIAALYEALGAAAPDAAALDRGVA